MSHAFTLLALIFSIFGLVAFVKTTNAPSSVSLPTSVMHIGNCTTINYSNCTSMEVGFIIDGVGSTLIQLTIGSIVGSNYTADFVFSTGSFYPQIADSGNTNVFAVWDSDIYKGNLIINNDGSGIFTLRTSRPLNGRVSYVPIPRLFHV
jgi:hypothetical protein